MELKIASDICFLAIPVLLRHDRRVVGSRYLPEIDCGSAARQSNIGARPFRSKHSGHLPTSAALFPAGRVPDIANANSYMPFRRYGAAAAALTVDEMARGDLQE